MPDRPASPPLLSRVPWIGIVFAAGAALVCAADAWAGETWAVRGKTYTDVRVREVTAATVTIFHDGGVAQLDLATLPPDLRERFHYDPAAAAEWARAARADLATTAKAGQPREERAATPPPGLAPPAPAAPITIANGQLVVEMRNEVDLRPTYTQHRLFFKDQGRRPSCAVFAVVSAYEFELARTTGRAEPLSEEFLIWATRSLQPGIPLDDGFHFNEVMSALQTHGVARLALMPNTFGRRIDDIRPSADAIFDASTRRNAVPVWFRTDDPHVVGRIIYALNCGTPVVVGMRWPHWRTLEGNNLLRDQQALANAAHAVTLVGYKCPSGRPADTVFIFRNSYGVGWGLGGCAFVAASYLQHHLTAAFHLTLPDSAPPSPTTS